MIKDEPDDHASASAPGEGLRLARARPRPVRGHRAVLPPRLQRATWSPSWFPSLDGVEEQLRAGASVADIGCGHGASTILMAQAFPESTFVGSDYHEARSRRRGARPSARGVDRSRDVRGRGRAGLRRRAVRPRLRLRRAARHGRSGRRGPSRPLAAGRRTAPGWSSSRWRPTRSRTTSTRSAACSTRARRCSARRRRSARRSGSHSAPRPGSSA